MIRFPDSLCILAALATATLVRSQTTTVTNTGVVVIERGDDRIEVRLQPGAAHPSVTVNGKAVPAREWQNDEGKHSVRSGEWRISTTQPSGGWQFPFVYTWGGEDAGKGWQDLTPDKNGLWRNLAGSEEKAAAARPYIGVQVGSVPAALAEHLGLDGTRCVLILSATPGGPAAKAGIRANDVLVAIDGAEAVTDEALSKAVAVKQPGDKMTLRVLRKARKQDIEVEVGKASSSAFELLKGNDEAWRALQTTPLNYINDGGSLWPAYRYLQGQKGEGGEDEVPAKATIESLQKQLEQIQRLCDRLEKQLERSTEKGR